MRELPTSPSFEQHFASTDYNRADPSSKLQPLSVQSLWRTSVLSSSSPGRHTTLDASCRPRRNNRNKGTGSTRPISFRRRFESTANRSHSSREFVFQRHHCSSPLWREPFWCDRCRFRSYSAGMCSRRRTTASLGQVFLAWYPSQGTGKYLFKKNKNGIIKMLQLNTGRFFVTRKIDACIMTINLLQRRCKNLKLAQSCATLCGNKCCVKNRPV